MKNEMYNKNISQVNKENEEKIKKIKSDFENKISNMIKINEEVFLYLFRKNQFKFQKLILIMWER